MSTLPPLILRFPFKSVFEFTKSLFPVSIHGEPSSNLKSPFVKSTNPLLKLFKPITPDFLLPLLIPIYVAWFFFLARFYLMPWLLGYSVMGMLSFPLESEIAGALWQTFN